MYGNSAGKRVAGMGESWRPDEQEHQLRDHGACAGFDGVNTLVLMDLHLVLSAVCCSSLVGSVSRSMLLR